MDGWLLTQGHVTLYPGHGQAFSREDLLQMLPTADAVLACGTMDAEMIKRARQLKLIVCYGAGYDAIDIAQATKQRIPVVNIPETVVAPTAELAVTLMMNLARRVPYLNNVMHTEQAVEAFGLGKQMSVSLYGSVLGIVGMGRIGSRVAQIGRALGMQIIYHARQPKPEQEAMGAEYRALPALMTQADFVSLHCPLTPETKGLITRELLFAMKPTAFLINTARGLVMDEAALLEALQQKRIAGAGLDVFVGEPRINPLFSSLPNVILTPHVGSNTLQARREMVREASLRIQEVVLEGRKPVHLLNPEAWSGGEPAQA